MRKPIVLDERYVYAYTIYYGIASLWGVLAFRNGLASVSDTGGGGAEAWFAFTLAAVSGVLAGLTTSNAQRAEKWLTVAWCAIVAVYPTAIIYQWIVENDIDRAAPSASTLMYLIFPAFRFVYLIRKTRKVAHG